MPTCTDARIDLGCIGRRPTQADLSGGDPSTDGGLVLAHRIDQQLGPGGTPASVIADPRDPGRIEHSPHDLPAQRPHGVRCGYEDLNDPKTLRDMC